MHHLCDSKLVSQLEQQASHLGLCSNRRIMHPVEDVDDPVLGLDHVERNLGQEGNGRNGLGNGVVEVPSEPVTLCQKPGLSARSISSTSSAGVWITTSTLSGILYSRRATLKPAPCAGAPPGPAAAAAARYRTSRCRRR